MKNKIIYHKYINELLKNQNITNTPLFQNIYDYQDYNELLKVVLKTIKENPHASLSTIRLLLFQKSGLKEITDYFVKLTQITPGLILDFGTDKTRDTILCGLSQEYTHDKQNNLIYNPKSLEQDTIFDLASTSKLFTCIAILKLNELNLLDLFTPINAIVPEFKNLNDVTIYDLLKFRVKIITASRIDMASTIEEAEQILFTAKKDENQIFDNAYTDMGAMTLRYIVERIAKMPFTDFVQEVILNHVKMVDTYLNVPQDKLYRVANENYSTIVYSDGTFTTRYDNIPGTAHDSKAIAIGSIKGIAPGHAGYFSTKDDMIKLGKALINGTIINKESVLSISDNLTGYQKEDGTFTQFYGSLVYLKQIDDENIYLPLSGKSFISPGFAGTTLCVDPLNKITLFIGANRLHNRIYQISPNQKNNIRINEHNKKTFLLPNNEEKIISSAFTQERRILLKLAIDLTLQYQLLEKIFPTEKEMHLVRELN